MTMKFDNELGHFFIVVIVVHCGPLSNHCNGPFLRWPLSPLPLSQRLEGLLPEDDSRDEDWRSVPEVIYMFIYISIRARGHALYLSLTFGERIIVHTRHFIHNRIIVI